MTQQVKDRADIPVESTWDAESVFASDEEWEQSFEATCDMLPQAEQFRGRLHESPETLADWFDFSDGLARATGPLRVYAALHHTVDSSNDRAKAMSDRVQGLLARVAGVTAFAEPEILALGRDTLQSWMEREPRLQQYAHYFDRLERRRDHIRSPEVEELLGLVGDPFRAAGQIHSTLVTADLQFRPATSATGEQIEVTQSNYQALLSSTDRQVRKTTWESYSDGHLSVEHAMAACLTAGVKQDVFNARARNYSSSLEAALAPDNLPPAVFHHLIDTYTAHLPTWHRYWRIRRQALGLDTLHVYDIWAPLSSDPPEIPYLDGVDLVVNGMAPLGEEYAAIVRRGATTERWVDVYPNRHKRNGAFSMSAPGTYPFILMSYSDSIQSVSTLAHELGHSLHSYYTLHTQPLRYAQYGLFLAEVASNFNQAMVRAHLLEVRQDPEFQLAIIEEAMYNFHRYFFIMPTLARFELEIHQRVERGEALTAESLKLLMTALFVEGYGGEVELDEERIGITWGEFATHLYSNFYVWKYATGISAANALVNRVVTEGPEASERYLDFLRAGGSMYPIDALKLAGVDMLSPEPVERAFGVLAEYVDRLEKLIEQVPMRSA